MSEAPERIMAYGEINTKWGVRSFQFCEFKCQPMPMQGMPPFPHTEYVRADRIEELEAKLATAVEALKIDPWFIGYGSWKKHVKDTLAELKGQTNE
jgi:hypothetical protein